MPRVLSLHYISRVDPARLPRRMRAQLHVVDVVVRFRDSDDRGISAFQINVPDLSKPRVSLHSISLSLFVYFGNLFMRNIISFLIIFLHLFNIFI